MTYKPDRAAQAEALAATKADAKEPNAGKTDNAELQRREYCRQRKLFCRNWISTGSADNL